MYEMIRCEIYNHFVHLHIKENVSRKKGRRSVMNSERIKKGDRVKLLPSVKEGERYGGYIIFAPMIFKDSLLVDREEDENSVLLENGFYYPREILTRASRKCLRKERRKRIEKGDKVRLLSFVKEGKKYGGCTMFPGMIFKGFLAVDGEPGETFVLLENGFFYPRKVLTKTLKASTREKILTLIEKLTFWRDSSFRRKLSFFQKLRRES